MSVCNIVFEADEIRCFTDTVVYDGREPVFLCDRKAHVVQSGRFAFAGRGHSLRLDLLEGLLDPIKDLDEARVLLRAVMNQDWAQPPKQHGLEITLMGWSDCDRDLRVVRFLRRHGEPAVAERELDRGVYIYPGSPSAKLPKTATDAQMLKACLAQYEFAHKLDEPMCIGGLIHRTRVTRDSASQEIFGEYPDYEKLAARFGCPNAAEHVAWKERCAA